MRGEMSWLWTLGTPPVRGAIALRFRVRIEGAGHVPRRGAVVLAPNHLSVLDGPMLAAVTSACRRRATRNLVAAEVFHGFIGWFLRQARQIPIRRGVGDSGALDEAVDALAEGGCVAIFPEGRVGDDPRGALQRIRSGLSRVALPAGAPVVPIGLWGAQRVWPRSGLDTRALRRRHPFAVVYGEPMGGRPGESPAAFRERFAASLAEQVARARTLAGDR